MYESSESRADLANWLTCVLQLPQIVTALFLLSAWSAATADLYVSSRFLFFLAKRGHAPAIFGATLRLGPSRGVKRNTFNFELNDITEADFDDELTGKRVTVIPIAGIIAGAAFSFLAFMSLGGGGASEVRSARRQSFRILIKLPGVQMAV